MPSVTTLIPASSISLPVWFIIVGPALLYFFIFFFTVKLRRTITAFFIGDIYLALDEHNKIVFDSKTTSSIHAILMNIGIVLVAVFERHEIIENSYHFSTIWSAFLGASFGYAIYDSYHMIRYWKHIGASIFLIHHILIIVAHFPVAAYGCVVVISTASYLFEASTPFLNLRAMCITLGYTKNIFFSIICGSLFFTFIVFRFLLSPILIYLVVVPYNYGLRHGCFKGAFEMAIGVTVFMLFLNWFWSFLIFKGAYEMIFTNKYTDIKKKKKN